VPGNANTITRQIQASSIDNIDIVRAFRVFRGGFRF